MPVGQEKEAYHSEKLAICVVCVRSVGVFDKTLRLVSV